MSCCAIKISDLNGHFRDYACTQKEKFGPDRGSNPEPLAPKARIIPLDHQAI